MAWRYLRQGLDRRGARRPARFFAGAVSLLAALLLLVAVAAAQESSPGGQSGVSSEAPSPAEAPLNVAFIWHQHQPLYVDPATGEAFLPWVRMHAIKDYYDMAAILEQYPSVKATFNLVPSLIEQLLGYYDGELRDSYQKVAMTPADQLTDEQKQFLLRRFFDANWDKVVARYPRYKELLDKRGADASDAAIAEAMTRFTESDYRDLQVWFNLAWFDPDFLENDPELAALVRKGRNFTEEDKQIIHAKQTEIIRQVLPLHRRLQESGQIEVITAPYAHPIMPLLYDTDLAHVASPDLPLPEVRFSYPEDIARHLERAVAIYREHFGRDPKGLWPSEQAVSKYIVPYVARAGFEWMVSSEGVLAKSLGVQLRGVDGSVVRPDLLYQAYIAEWEGEQVAILFRDIVLSDRIGFEYSGRSGEAAAADLISYLHRVRRQLGPEASEKVVVIALDGENAWEYYDNDGKEFFHALYRALEEDPLLNTVTVSEYLAAHPPTVVLDNLWTGSWISDNLETWIGESEENTAWTLLAGARAALAEYEARYGHDPAHADRIAAAWDAMLAAEGSDWFWWYGNDQDSGNDAAFDQLFRRHVAGVYERLGLTPPSRLARPIVAPAPARPARPVTALSAPLADGWADFQEWDAAARYDAAEGGTLRALYVAVDNQQLTLRVDFSQQARQLVGKPLELLIYLDHPTKEPVNDGTRYGAAREDGIILGFGPAYEVRLDLAGAPAGLRPPVTVSEATGDGAWRDVTTLRQAGLGGIFEVRIPFEVLGYQPGDAVRLVAVLAERTDAAGGAAVERERLPVDGPAVVYVPRPTEGTLVFRMEDPEGDDYGPGTYVYPTNAVFEPGVFDLTAFEVYETESDVVFHVQFRGPINNVWNSPIGLSVQTIDIYIDTDGVPGSGSTEALAGRRVRVAPDSAWEYAVWVEGWNQKLFTADGVESPARVRAVTDPIHRRVTIQVPKSAIGSPQPHWGYTVLILGQEGYPASDSLRVREVLRVAQEWRFGGGHDGPFDPNVIDWLAAPGVQEQALSAYDVEAGRLAEVHAVRGE
ncbi:MAG: glucodextranase DOMON-like domain-containing protein [Limnochordales bacterium]|nr:glycoside hydrolase family 57 [Bacillota bacterium]